MEFSYSSDFKKSLEIIKSKNPQLSVKVKKQLHYFQQDARHPSLRTHKLTGNLSNTYSISVDRSIRILYRVKHNRAVFYKIGTHDEVYGK